VRWRPLTRSPAFVGYRSPRTICFVISLTRAPNDGFDDLDIPSGELVAGAVALYQAPTGFLFFMPTRFHGNSLIASVFAVCRHTRVIQLVSPA